MEEKARAVLDRTARVAALSLAVALLFGAGSAWAQTTRYLGDGALQNSRGGWDLPAQGTCPAGAAAGYSGIDTRPECVALRLNVIQANCTAPNNQSWTTSGVCNDLVNTTQVACEAQPDRLWNPGTSVCAVVMMDDDRNDVTCMKHGGTWVTAGTCTGAWVMPARTAYTPNLFTGTGPGDQCLRCHNSATQYNGPRVRDTEDTLYMGHKNMSRKVTVGTPWGGPPFKCSNPLYTNEKTCEENLGTWDPVAAYPADDTGNLINWTTGQITVGGNARDLKWIYGDWLAALPRAIYAAPASASKTCTNPLYTTQATCEAALFSWVFNAGASYSCGRCHTTGWTSDATIAAQNLIDPRLTKEPESSFVGITWDRLGDAPFGKVNLTGGVAADANKYSSWDYWGISCTRCHSSAINPAAPDASTPPQYSAAPGMSTHHSNLTAADANNGVCTDTRFTSGVSGVGNGTFEANCVANGGSFLTACSVNPTPNVCTITAGVDAASCGTALGTWIAAPFCSNAFYTTSADCTANGFTWTQGWCNDPVNVPTGAPLACPAGRTVRLNGSQASCQVAAATWSFSKCSVEGVCNKGPAYTTKTTCEAVPGGQFRYNTDIVRCVDAGGRWTGNNTNRGQMITSLCMQCHRQETSGYPNTNGTCSVVGKTTQGACVAASGVWTDTGGGIPMLVGPYHSTVTFPSHPHAYQFLNSPHGKFTGKFSEVATGKFNFAGTGLYKSFFMNDAEAANTGNGCTGCHEVHTSTVAGERPFREECTACHTKSLNLIQHPKGTGTPMPTEILGTPEEFEACVACHMPEGRHLFRINVDKNYSMLPMPAAITANVAPNTAPDGTWLNAVWNDLDSSCGKCHGGGTSNPKTTGSISAASAVLTVASSTGFAANEKIRITGAGAYYYDDIGHSGKNTDFDTYIKSVDSATQITLAGTATKTVAGAAVVQNATSPEAGYISKVALAGYAKAIHDDKPFASFSFTYGANGATVNVDAGASKCSGSAANCNAYDWDWGDGSAHGSGVTASHTYVPTPPSQDFTITLTVEQYSVGGGVATQKFTAYTVINRPAADGTCALDYTAWTATCSSTGATPDAGFQQLVFDWGDGTVLSTVTSAPWGAPVVHSFLVPGAYTIKLKVVDTLGQQSTKKFLPATVPANFVYSTVSGTIFDKLATPLAAAQIQVKKSGTLVKSTMSAANGAYTTGNMKPGTYTLTVTKSGYTFPAPVTVTIPPSATQNITATGP